MSEFHLHYNIRTVRFLTCNVTAGVLTFFVLGLRDRPHKTTRQPATSLHFYSAGEKGYSARVCIVSSWYKVTAQPMCAELNCYYYLSADGKNDSRCQSPGPQLSFLSSFSKRCSDPTMRRGDLTVSTYAVNQYAAA